MKSMFYHAYNGYLDKAYPLDELKPLTCKGSVFATFLYKLSEFQEWTPGEALVSL